MSDDKKLMSVRVKEDFHREIKIKLAQEDRKFSEVARKLFQKWLDGDIELES